MSDTTHPASMTPFVKAHAYGNDFIPFVKAHAYGNDFLIIDEVFAKNQHAALAKKLCARNTSIGADGIEFLERHANGTLFLRLFNADGSEAELSGNGTRCVAAWLALKENKKEVVFNTPGGPRRCRVVRSETATKFLIETEMGIPHVAELVIEVEGIGSVAGAYVNVGNPHFVLFVEDETFRKYDMRWQDLGAIICTHRKFPQGANVEFVHIRSGSEIAFRIYERGCGPTTSSGTGTCASAAAAIVLGMANPHIVAHAEGGEQLVFWDTRNEQMCLSGLAEFVCEGKVAAL